jgi:hypothetical protein
MIIEVQLDGRGAVRIEADYAISVKQTKGLIDHATEALSRSRPKAQPIGFGAGSGSDTERSHHQDPDPYEFGQVYR